MKPGYGEKTSDTVNLSSRQRNELQLKLPIGFGKIGASVLDSDNNPVVGAKIQAVNFPDFTALGEASTDSDGKSVVALRADKKAFLVVSAEGFSQTTTIPMQMQKDVTIEKSVMLEKPAQSFDVEFEGLYVGNESVSGSGTAALNAGQSYTAKLKLFIPKGTVFDEALVHLRTGKEESNAIERDNLYITGVRAAYSGLSRGTTYNSPTGQATDAQHLTSGNAKWVNAVFSKAGEGIYEVEADIQVREEAKIGSLLEIFYRASGKSGGLIRKPVDAALGTSEFSAEKQGLYANALKRTFSVGPSSLCGEDFCASYSVQDLREGIVSGIVDNYTAQISNKYTLKFDISSVSETPFSAAQISLKDKASGISIDSYKITTPFGDERAGVKSGSEVSVALGDVSKDSTVKGEITFEAKKEGTITLEISLLSGSGAASEVYRKTIYIKVLPAEGLTIDVLPKVIVPLINNNILVKVSDENGASAVSNAVVSVKVNGTVIASGPTDSDGVYAYTLLSPADGATIGIAAEKSGFKASEKEIKVSGNILASDPASIKLSATVNDSLFKTISASILNYSQIPLGVEKVSVSRDFDGFVDFTFDEPTAGTVIENDGNAALSGTLKLGARGKEISQPLRIQGSLNVYVSSDAFQKKWVASIPLEVSIGFGDSIDSTDCFNVFPSEWNIFGSSSESKKLSVTISNSCKVKGGGVALKNISLRVNSGNESQIGKFRVSSTIPGGKTAELTNNFNVIADTLAGNAEETLTIEFTPGDIVSGKMDGKIEVKADHFTKNGSDDLVQAIKLKANINNLSECVEILTNNDLTINSCPYNTGFGNYGGQFSQFQNSRYSAYDPYSSRYGYGTGIPPYLGSAGQQNNVLGDSYYDYTGSAYPNAYYSQPFYDPNALNSSLSNSWNCGTGSFTVRNSCESSIDLSFDAQAGINVKDKTLTIAPGDEGEVTVEPTNFFGRYALNVKAKATDSKEKSIGLRTLYVNVTNELTKNYKDCISVSPSGTLSFNNFLGKPVELKVINTCYNEGVFLDESNETIFFSGTEVSTPTDQGSGFREMVESWSFIDSDFSTAPNGKVTQIMTFEVVKSLKEYRNNAPAAKFFEANPFADIGNLRYFLSSGYYSVFGSTNLVVSFVTPYGSRSKASFRMSVRDYWPLLEFAESTADKFVSYGEPSLTPSQCINKSALDFTNITGGDLPWDRVYSTELNGGLFVIARKDPVTKKETGGCGTTDFLGGVSPTVFKDSRTGLIMVVRQVGSQELEISFNINDGPWNGKKASFEFTPLGQVTRISPPGQQLVGLPIKINIAADPKISGTGGPGGPGGPGGTGALACPAGTEAATNDIYKKYGLQHLSFEWRPTEIPATACDEYLKASGFETPRSLNLDKADAAWFCDATQATISLAKKLAEVKKEAEAIKAAVGGQGKCKGTLCGNSQNSTEMFRYVLEQSPAGDYFTETGSDKKPALVNLGAIDAETIEKGLSITVNDIRSRAVSADNQAQNQRISEDATPLLGKLGEIANNPELKGASIVLELASWPTSAQKPQELIPETEAIDAAKGWYVVPLASYRTFRDKLRACPADVASCTIEVGGKKVDVSTEFLTLFINNGNWKLTAKNTLDLSGNVKKLVMQKAKWNDELKAKVSAGTKSYRDFYEFYMENITPTVYLMKDKYNSTFVSAFKAKSGDFLSGNGLSSTTISFANEEGKADFETGAGDYNVTISYAWGAGNDNAKITLKKNNDLAKIDSDNKTQYAKNILFSTPIDGDIAWGTSFSKASAGSQLVFNYFDEALQNPELLPVTKSKADAPYISTFTYKKDPESAKAGKIISIKKDSVEFTPSDPVGIDVTVLKRSGKDIDAGFLYKFSHGNNNEVKYDEQWLIKGTDTIGGSAEPSVKAEQEINGSALCENLGGTYEGIVVKNGRSGSTVYSKTVFIPARSGGGTAVQFNLACIKDSGPAKATDAFTGSALESPQDLTGESLRDTLRQRLNLAALLKLAADASDSENAKLCISTTDGLSLYWNPAAFSK